MASRPYASAPMVRAYSSVSTAPPTNGGRHQRRETAQRGVQPHDGVDDVLRGHVLAQIVYGEAVVFQQQPDDVFADVVNVALHGGQHKITAGGRLLYREGGLDFRAGAAGRLCGHHQLRQEDAAALEALSDGVQSGDDLFADERERLAGAQRLRSLPRRLGGQSALDGAAKAG